jgi:hypothetical protein
MRIRIARIAIALLGAVLMTGPAMADVTITATQQGKGMMAKLMTGEAVTRIKGGKCAATAPRVTGRPRRSSIWTRTEARRMT